MEGPGSACSVYVTENSLPIQYEEAAYTIRSANEAEMNLSPPPEMAAPANRFANAKRRYRPPAFKKLALADVNRLLESNLSSHDPAVREQIEEFRLVLERRGSR